MSDQWTDRLSEYLDGDLPEAEHAALEAHLAECPTCASVLNELRRVVGRARALEPRSPVHELWPGIAARIGATAALPGVEPLAGRRRPLRRLSFSLPQLAAAGIALTAISSAAAWMLHPDMPAVAVSSPSPARPSAISVGSNPTAAQSYAAAVDDLERVLAAGRGQLDTATVRVIEQNLAVIDRAIVQAQRAVLADSANLYLNSHLAETMRRKLELLRQAAALVSTMS